MLIQSSHLKNNNIFIAACIVIINVAFKLINITHDPIWYDECFSIFYSQGTFTDILHVSEWDIAPPFFNLLLHIWIKLFGLSELSMRIVPVLLSSLTAGVLYLFLKQYINFRTAITASVLYLFSNISFFYAHEVRGYTFILFISTISIWLFIKLIDKPTYLTCIALGTTYYMLIMTHYLTFFILLAQGILFLFFLNKSLFKFYLTAVVSFFILLIHWLPRMIEIFTGGSKHWLQSPNLANLVEFIFSINNGDIQFIVINVLACLGSVSIILKKEKWFPDKITKAILIYSILISFVTVFLNYIISSSIPIFLDRYLLFTLIGFIILYAIFISRISLADTYYYPLIIVVAICAFSQVSINEPIKKMDYRNGVRYIKSEQDSNSIVFIQSVDVGALFAYYYDKDVFTHYMDLENTLKQKNVFMANDSTKMSFLNDSRHKKIIHVETFSEYSDPNKTSQAWLSKNGYNKIKVKDDLVGVKITTYKKE